MPHHTLSDEDVQRIAEAVAAVEDVDDSRGFRVPPEAHYNSHARLDSLLDSYDSASNIVMKFLIGLVIVGIFGVAAVGVGWHK